jgi:hypothetical protein
MASLTATTLIFKREGGLETLRHHRDRRNPFGPPVPIASKLDVSQRLFRPLKHRSWGVSGQLARHDRSKSYDPWLSLPEFERPGQRWRSAISYWVHPEPPIETACHRRKLAAAMAISDRTRIAAPLILKITLIGALGGAAYSYMTTTAAGGSGVTGVERGLLIGAIIASLLTSLNVWALQAPIGSSLSRTPFLLHVGLKSLVYLVVFMLGNAAGQRLLPIAPVAGVRIGLADILFFFAFSFAISFLLDLNSLLGQNVLVSFVTGRYFPTSSSESFSSSTCRIRLLPRNASAKSTSIASSTALSATSRVRSWCKEARFTSTSATRSS